MSKRAIILAGGKGTRLRPYTLVLPKPLMPIGEYPILEVIIRQLVKYEFDHITLAVNHQADLFKTYFSNGEKWGIKIDYILEDSPLGTFGPLSIINDLPENFLVMNGDVLSDINFSKFYNEHILNKRLFTISSKYREQYIDYGVLETNKDMYLSDFVEKPTNTFEVSMGVYMVNRNIVNLIPANQQYGFDNLMRDMLNKKMDIYVSNHDGYWLDIGRPDDYMQAIEEFEKLKGIFL